MNYSVPKIIIFSSISLSLFFSSSVHSMIRPDSSNTQTPSYILNFMWINKELDQNQYYFYSNKKGTESKNIGEKRKIVEIDIDTQRENFEKQLLNPISQWAKKNPTTIIYLWYDSEFATDVAVKNVKNAIFLKEDLKNLKLKDVRELSIVKENKEIFDNNISVYFRADLLRVIATLSLAEKEAAQYIIYSDLNIPACTQKELFEENEDTPLIKPSAIIDGYANRKLHNQNYIINYEILDLCERIKNLKRKKPCEILNQYGLTLAKNNVNQAANIDFFEARDLYENAFFIINSSNKTMLKVIKICLIENSIRNFKELTNIDQVIWSNYPKIILFYNFLLGRIETRETIKELNELWKKNERTFVHHAVDTIFCSKGYYEIKPFQGRNCRGRISSYIILVQITQDEFDQEAKNLRSTLVKEFDLNYYESFCNLNLDIGHWTTKNITPCTLNEDITEKNNQVEKTVLVLTYSNINMLEDLLIETITQQVNKPISSFHT